MFEINEEELRILQILDAIIEQESVRSMIDSIVSQVEWKLNQLPEALLAWESVPLILYGRELPDKIRSSWVFVLRSRSATGPERHPGSHQRMMSYRGYSRKHWQSER